jgi:hypothetical protein
VQGRGAHACPEHRRRACGDLHRGLYCAGVRDAEAAAQVTPLTTDSIVPVAYKNHSTCGHGAGHPPGGVPALPPHTAVPASGRRKLQARSRTLHFINPPAATQRACMHACMALAVPPQTKGLDTGAAQASLYACGASGQCCRWSGAE